MSFISDLLIEISSFRIRIGNKLNALKTLIDGKANIDGSNIPYDTKWSHLKAGGLGDYYYVDTGLGSNFTRVMVWDQGGWFWTNKSGMQTWLGLSDYILKDKIGARNYAYVKNLLPQAGVTVAQNQHGTYITGLNQRLNNIRFSDATSDFGTFKENTQYTLFLRVLNTSGNGRINIRYTDGTTTSNIFPQGGTLGDVPNFVSVISTENKTVNFIYGTYGSGGTFYLYDLLFVEGTTFTGWIPAPEDQVADWDEQSPLLLSFIRNKPDLSQYALVSQLTDNNYLESIITTNGTTAGTVYTFKRVGLSDLTLQLTAASASFSGVVTTGAQTFEGIKTFLKSPKVPNAINSDEAVNKGQLDAVEAAIPTNNDQLANGAGYLTSFTETDPVFMASPAYGISLGDIANWNQAFGWGDHSGLYVSTSGASQISSGGRLTISNDDHSGWFNNIVGDPERYYTRRNLSIESSNNQMSFFIHGASNSRRAGIQVGHRGNFNNTGILELNPFGGEVRINGAIATHIDNLDSQATSLGFIKSNVLGNYLPLSGGTMSGGIDIIKNGQAGADTKFLTLRDTDYGTNQGRVDITMLATNTNTATNRGAIISMRRTNSLGALHFEVADNNLLSLIGHSQNVGVSVETPTEKLDVNGNIRVRALTSSGFVKTSANGTLSVDTNDYALSSQLSGYVPTSRTITINGVSQNLSANRSWTIPDNDTITRLRGTTSGAFTSGDLTLLAGANTTITQSGANITIASTNTNTTYSAGTGLSLTGTTFANTAPNATHTGDVTGATVLTIANSAVTHDKYQNIAQNTFLGRIASGSGSPTALTVAQMQTALGIPTNIGVTNVSATVAGNALDVNVTNPSTTPALGFTWAGNSNQVVLGNGSLAALPVNTVTQIGANGAGYSSGNINFVSGDSIIITKTGNNVTVNSVPSRSTELYQYHGQSANVPAGFRNSIVHIDGVGEQITLDPGEYDGDKVYISACNTSPEYSVIGLDDSLDACQVTGSHTVYTNSIWVWFESNNMWLRAG